MTPSPREWIIGTHHLRFEAPDVIWATFRGACSHEQALAIVKVYRQLGTLQPFFILNDMEHAEGMDAESRRHMSENLQGEWMLGVIFFKARLLHRALAQGLILAAAMFHTENPSTPDVHFVSSREDAVELLTRLRAEPRALPR